MNLNRLVLKPSRVHVCPLELLQIVGELVASRLFGLVTVWFRSLAYHYATVVSKTKGLSSGVIEAVDVAEVRRFALTASRPALPPYGPDLNPIEQFFSKLIQMLRKAKERTIEATWQRIGLILQNFKPL